MSGTRPARLFSTEAWPAPPVLRTRHDRVLEALASERLDVGTGGAAGRSEYAPGMPWKAMNPVMLPIQACRGRERGSAGVSTPNGAWSTRAHAIRIPASNARSCSSSPGAPAATWGMRTNRATPRGDAACRCRYGASAAPRRTESARARNTARAKPRGRGRRRRPPSRLTRRAPPLPSRSVRPGWRYRRPDRRAA